MNTSDQQSVDTITDEGIDLSQVLQFLLNNWKQALAGAFIGSALGLGWWSSLAAYKAESVLINNGALSFMSWRGLQKNLPILASQMVETNQVKVDQESMYKKMADAKWWAQNVVPTYSLTKTDTKDLATISKDLQESGGTNILNLVVTAKGSGKESAEANVDVVTRFIKQGSAYLSIKSMINGYESQVLNTDAELQKKILDAEVELKFLRDRAKNLEVLRQRFPGNAAVTTQQIVDLKDSNAKFMPISTQLVAVNTDINNTVELLQRMRDQSAKSKVMRRFIDQATPILAKETDGLALADALLKIETTIRSEIDQGDTNGMQTLNDIEAAIVGVRTFFSKGLEADLVPQVTKPGALLPVAAGFFGGGAVMFLYVLARRALVQLRSRQSKAN